MTEWMDKLQAERTFLHEQITDTEHKIARYANALESCHECQEADSLQTMLRITQEQRDLLNELSARQTEENALSLGSLITQRMDSLINEAARLESGWHPGHAISPAYWELENKREFLADLLRRFHAWESGRPYYPPISPNGQSSRNGEKGPTPPEGYSHPWYIPVPRNSGVNNGKSDADGDLAALNTTQEAIYHALRQQGFPEHHLKVIPQPDGSVFIMGYSHNEDERDQILKTAGSIPGIREVLAGIQIVDAAHCPACTLSS